MPLPAHIRSLFAASALFCAGIVAAQSDASLAEARRLLGERNPQAAYGLLAPFETQRAGQPEFDYLLGIAALDAGEITRAIFALERVLAVQPGNTLARAEIGRAYLAAGEAENARGELVQVRAAPIPAEAHAAVDRLLGAISQLQAESTARVRWYAEAGVGHDSNVNSATGSSAVAIPALGGLVFTLDPASRNVHDLYLQVGAGVNLRVPLAPDLSLSATASTLHTFNHDVDRFNSGVLDTSAGLSKTVGAHVFTGAVQIGANWVGGSRFREAFGALGQWQINLSTREQASIFAQSTRLTYPGNVIRNADRYLLGAGYARALDAGPVVFASIYAGQEDERKAAIAHLGHDFKGLRGGLQWQTGASMQVFANASYEERNYGGSEPLFNRARNDRQTGLTVGAHVALAPGWRLTPQLAYIENASNIAIYAFRRSIASLLFRREF